MQPLPAGLLDRLAACRRLLVLTGAGVSAASGIPTFRDAGDGLWARFRPEDLATPAAFARDPQLVWRWYQWRRSLIAGASPNAAHRAIAALEQLLPRVVVVTQNVDGLQQRAGSSAVIEFHGSIWHDRCSAGCGRRCPADPALDEPPRCAGCGAAMRPDVVWFGEGIPPDALNAALEAAAACDALLVAGTAGVVEPAASLARIAAERDALLIEANLETTPLSPLADCRLAGDVAETLPALRAALNRMS